MQPTTRRAFHRIAAGALAYPFAGCVSRDPRILVGFAQIDVGGVWRAAETASMKAAAAERGDRFALAVTDAQDQTVKQIGDVEDLIARRARAIFLAPREFDGVEPALEAARHAGVPVFLIDRAAEGEPGVDFACFIGSDFVEQGRRAAGWLAKATGGRAGIVELGGTVGSSVANDRGRGFREGIARYPEMRIVAGQTASFSRTAGQAVLANLLQSMGAEITAVYAHNDEMALGTIQAARAAGRRPGGDTLFVSIDGQRSALEAIIRGELGASVESNPRFGPLAFDTLERHLAGEAVPTRIVLRDRLFDASNAADFRDDAY